MTNQTEETRTEAQVTEYSKNIRHRINRNLGHLARVKKMIDEGNDYNRVMMQLSAVRAALASTANELMLDEMGRALEDARENNDTERLDDVFFTVRKYFSR